MHRKAAWIVGVLLLAWVAPEVRGAVKEKDLPPKYAHWLTIVEPLLSKEEKAAFLELELDYQRDAFIERFWKARDPYPQTARNEFKEKWERRVEEALREYRSLSDDRSQILLMNGFPTARIPISCPDLWPGEVWYYQYAEAIREEVAILFVQRGAGRYRLWDPLDGIETLIRFINPSASIGRVIEDAITGCILEQENALRAVLNAALGGPSRMGYSSQVQRMLVLPSKPTGEWVQTFHAYSTEIPEGAATFDADVEVEYPGRNQNRTLVQILLSVPKEQLSTATLGDANTYNLIATGEILRGERLFENFRYRFNFPATQVGTEQIPMVLERMLRPGDYELVLKLEDLNAKSFYHVKQAIEVPKVEEARFEPKDEETRRLLAEANAALSATDTSLQIVPPRGDLITGLTRFDTLITGPDIAQVSFSVDGHGKLIKKRPPYEVELDLGTLPRLRTIAAVAYNSTGQEVARDELQLNTSSHRFNVRLIEPRRGGQYQRSLRAEAQVDVPDGKVVERVEFYLNETLVATLFQPPFAQPIILPTEGELAYVRAVAYQPDGNSTEDLVFVNAPDYLEEVDIQFVELYIAVLNNEKRPVMGLAQADFEVIEDGIQQVPTRFNEVSNLPIHAGILLDVSASMEERMGTAQQAAMDFFEQAITPKDRATLITFNDHPNLAVKFTNEIQDLAGGLAGLQAERGTALFDSLVFALHYFNGIKGQRALILLSDGEDEHSRFSFDDALDFARRAGVAIYTVGLDLGRGHGEARRRLSKFSNETGGRPFFIDTIEELPAVYAEIQSELRSRYYLAYQSTNTDASEEFRTIEVDLAARGLEAKTLRGYYP